MNPSDDIKKQFKFIKTNIMPIFKHKVALNLADHAKEHFKDDMDLYLTKKEKGKKVSAKIEGSAMPLNEVEAELLETKIKKYLSDNLNSKIFEERAK